MMLGYFGLIYAEYLRIFHTPSMIGFGFDMFHAESLGWLPNFALLWSQRDDPITWAAYVHVDGYDCQCSLHLLPHLLFAAGGIGGFSHEWINSYSEEVFRSPDRTLSSSPIFTRGQDTAKMTEGRADTVDDDLSTMVTLVNSHRTSTRICVIGRWPLIH